MAAQAPVAPSPRPIQKAPAKRDLRHIQAASNTRATQRQNGTGLYTQGPFVRRQLEWQAWPELTLKLSGIAESATTMSLFKAFDREGVISFIDIFEDRGKRNGRGKIRFSPPPKTDFWNRNNGRYQMIDENRLGYLLRVDLESRADRQQMLQSPIRKHVFYQAVMKLAPQELVFGIIEEENIIMACSRIQQGQMEPISLQVDLRKRRLTVQFHVSFLDPRQQGVTDYESNAKPRQNDRVNTYMFQVPFDMLKSIKNLDYEKYGIQDYFGLVISLDSPPAFYRKQIGAEAGHVPGSLTWSEFDTWYRQTDIDYDPIRLNTIKVALHKEHPEIDTGRWTTYLLTFKKSSIDMQIYGQLKSALNDFNIDMEDAQYQINWEPNVAEVWRLLDTPSAQNLNAELASLDPEEISLFLLFEVRYQLEVCISKNFINDHNITREFVQRLVQMSLVDPGKARNILEYVAEQGTRVFDPMTIFTSQEALAYAARVDIPHYCAYVRKATITPSTIYFSTPTVETTNRVLRQFQRENKAGRFLRVQFTDELSEGKINSTFKKKRNDELYTRVYRTLFNGIRIGDRHFQFLAFGNSQFRENGAYFFCETDELSCDDIRAWMGNFSHINVVAKYAARLGQCFSTTRAINGLSNPTLVKIPDVERNDYCFTDGVGKISSFMAQMITTELGLPGNTVPSAFQFRLGGCKGILVTWPDAKEKEVHIRPSQQKFAAIYNGLEIIRCSQFSAASLNRQTITILSALGVPDDAFLKMLDEQLKNYQLAMEDDDLAVSLLCRYIDDSQMTINIATMIRNGFMTQKDPFVISLLHLWRAWSIRLLKEKAKIIVEDGAFVLGCVDETATLQGFVTPTLARGEKVNINELPEIFLQVPDKVDPTKFIVIQGVCLVGRNPSLHPGDLRVVRAVNVPALHHLRNVVIFPQNGDRDIPSMCSGGDLDGDDFFVLWDKGLQPERWNCEPMDFTPPTPKVIKRAVKMTDLMKFFVVFMKNDSLPTIAHAHLAQSDYLENGVDDQKCLELAQLHSKAVDYVKSGQPAEMPKYLYPRKYPHFMEKKHKPKEQQYTSAKILGQLYDRVETVNFVPQWEYKFDLRILRAYKLDDALLKTARQVKTQYDIAMRRILANQEIGSEFEVWTTFVLNKPRAGNDYKYQEEVARLSTALKDQFRAVCIEKAGSRDFSALGPFVAGMYKVTKEELDIALAECRATKLVAGRPVPKRKMEPKSMPLISFPWLFEKELGRIATGMDATAGLEELGLLPFDYKVDGNAKKRHVSHIADFDDFVQQEEGVIVHRGEELDLFRPDIIGFSDDEEFLDEEESRDPELLTSEDLRIDDSDSDGSDEKKIRTGVEDVVKPAALQGLIGTEEAARRLQERSTMLPSALVTSSNVQSAPAVADSGVRRSPFVKPSASEGSDKQSSSATYSDAGSFHESSLTDSSAFTDSVEQTALPAEEAGLFEAEDATSDEDSDSEESKQVNIKINQPEESDDDNVEEEEEVVEEQEQLQIEESALEKLARMQRR